MDDRNDDRKRDDAPCLTFTAEAMAVDRHDRRRLRSPEQVRKQPLTGQTDLFAVGVLLWEMLVDHRLFARSDPDATLRAVTSNRCSRPL